MSNLRTRPATQTDLPRLAELWQERSDIRAQFDTRFHPRRDGAEHWRAVAQMWLTSPDFTVVVAQRDDLIVGYGIGRLGDAPPGLQPSRIGEVLDMAVDAHRGQGGVGTALWEALRHWFEERNISATLVHVPRRSAVEQAFWRAQGATEWTDIMWLPTKDTK